MLHCVINQLLLHQRSLHIMLNTLRKQRGCQTTTPQKTTPSLPRAETCPNTLLCTMKAQFCPEGTLSGKLRLQFLQSWAWHTSAVKRLPLFVSWTVILSYGTGEGQKVQTWGCNYLSGCDISVPSQLCAILFHFLQHWLIHGIEEQVGSSTFSSQCLVPNLGKERANRNVFERLNISSKCV